MSHAKSFIILSLKVLLFHLWIKKDCRMLFLSYTFLCYEGCFQDTHDCNKIIVLP